MAFNLMIVQEELPLLLQSYERREHFEDVLALLEAGLSLERAHVSCALNIICCSLTIQIRWASLQNYQLSTANTSPRSVSSVNPARPAHQYSRSNGASEAFRCAHQYSQGG